MKVLAIVASLLLTLNASGQKSAENPPGVLLVGHGEHGSLRVILAGRDGKPAGHVGVMVVGECPDEVCPMVVSSMMTNAVGELQFDPISVGRYLVCSSPWADSDSPTRICFLDSAVAGAYCTIEITAEYPEVELRMHIPKHGIKSDKPQDQDSCRQSRQKATRLH